MAYKKKGQGKPNFKPQGNKKSGNRSGGSLYKPPAPLYTPSKSFNTRKEHDTQGKDYQSRNGGKGKKR